MKRRTGFLTGASGLIMAASLLLNGFAAAQGYENEIQNLSAKMAQKIVNSGKSKIAVVDFTDLKGNVTELGRFIAEEFSVALLESSQGFEVVDRTHLQSILKEHKLSETGVIDPQTARKLGQFAGVDALVTGTITPLGESVRLAVKVLDVETAKVISATSGNIPATDAIKILLNSNIQAGTNNSNTNKKTAPPADSTQSVSANGFTFSNPSCKRAGTTVTCSLLITSNGEDRNLEIDADDNDYSETKILDNLGNEYIAAKVQIGEKTSEYSLANRFPADIPTKVLFRFDGIVQEATTVSLVFGGSSGGTFYVQLKNLPLME